MGSNPTPTAMTDRNLQLVAKDVEIQVLKRFLKQSYNRITQLEDELWEYEKELYPGRYRANSR